MGEKKTIEGCQTVETKHGKKVSICPGKDGLAVKEIQ